VRKSSEVHATSSPSMDISKASNFERYVADLLRRDAAQLKALWAQLDQSGAFDLSGEKFRDMIAATGFSSGSSTHADRISTIRGMHEDYGVIVDTHTADGIKVGLEHREAGVPMICLETAQPAKFSETIHEALGREPARPAGFEKIEALPQRFEVLDADVAEVKAFIAART
jgi:threonine synthase